MRIGTIAGLAFLGCVGCSESDESQSDAEWVASALPSASDPAATIRVVAGEGERGCSLFWNGDAISADQLAQKSSETMHIAVVSAGGIDRISADRIPYLKLEVGPDVGFDCIGPTLETIRKGGYSRIGLKPDLTGPTPHFLHFPLTQVGAAPPIVTVTVTPAGTITWNGEQADLAGLGDLAHELAAAGRSAGKGGSLVVKPARQAGFEAVYDAIRVIRENGVEPDWATQ